jgi:hypothetical protein
LAARAEPAGAAAAGAAAAGAALGVVRAGAEFRLERADAESLGEGCKYTHARARTHTQRHGQGGKPLETQRCIGSWWASE